MDKAFQNKWAILMGINKYAHVKQLNHCNNDVTEVGKAFREFLEFPEENILTFTEASPIKPERDAFFHAMGELKDSGRITENDLMIFYFSGHGIRNHSDNKD